MARGSKHLATLILYFNLIQKACYLSKKNFKKNELFSPVRDIYFKKPMGIHTQESLQRLFEASRLRSEKKKQEEELKYRKAQESTRKALALQQSKEKEKTSQKPLKQEIRYITVYNSNLIEREPSDRDLYLTREELMEAEDRGEGLINWSAWQRLIEETKQLLQQ